MKEYLDILEEVLETGIEKTDRTGTGTISKFGMQTRFDLSKGFPAVTTKKLAWKAVVSELLWFLEGSTDERRLAELLYSKDRTEIIDKQTIWTANADHQGKELGYINFEYEKELGPVYGWQWRKFGKAHNGKSGSLYGTDQIEYILKEINSNPDSRRIVLNAWNPSDIRYMALPPCHMTCIFNITNNKLNCMLIVRSNDLFLGAPFNIASYALLTHIIARQCELDVGELVYTMGDAHIYKNHIDQVKLQLTKEPYVLPELIIDDEFDLLDRLTNGMKLSDTKLFTLKNYNSHGLIKAPMAV